MERNEHRGICGGENGIDGTLSVAEPTMDHVHESSTLSPTPSSTYWPVVFLAFSILAKYFYFLELE